MRNGNGNWSITVVGRGSERRERRAWDQSLEHFMPTLACRMNERERERERRVKKTKTERERESEGKGKANKWRYDEMNFQVPISLSISNPKLIYLLAMKYEWDNLLSLFNHTLAIM